MSTIHLSVVVPVFNASEFIEGNVALLVEQLEKQHYPWELILVDDGSYDNSLSVLNRITEKYQNIKVVSNRKNRGKGYAIRHGFGEARGRYLVFNDSDLAYQPDQIFRILEVLEKGADVAIACRVLPESRYEISPVFFRYLYTRHLMGRFFNLLVRLWLLPELLDTQAGLKGFRKEAAQAIFTKQTLERFSFDVEALYVAKKLGFIIHQVPIRFRYFHEKSTVNFFQDTVRMLRDLWKVKRNDHQGYYK